MRIKENSDSWRASSILRCGIKHDHSEISIMFHSSKDTRKWCSGKIGVKHKVIWRVEQGFFGDKYKTGNCLHCGKIKFSKV